METQPEQTFAATALEPSDERVVMEAPQPNNSHDARLSRVLDYQASSLLKDDPLEANLGSINSGLMRVALWLDETIEQAMEGGPPNVERLTRILPAIETHLRVTRQVDRFANIEVRAAEARKPKPSDNNVAVLNLDLTSSTGKDQSEDSVI